MNDERTADSSFRVPHSSLAVLAATNEVNDLHRVAGTQNCPLPVCTAHHSPVNLDRNLFGLELKK